MVDYSKWKNIEISDDEDETHPNIDTGSLFRWRHQARVERMEEQKREKEALETSKEDNIRKLQATKAKLSETNNKEANMEDLQKTLKDLEKENEKLKQKEKELEKKEKSAPWNVDTISKSGFNKTVINTPVAPSTEGLSDEQREENMHKFIKENEKLLKQFGMLRKYDDSKRFLQEHSQLACEETANYLVIWCINLMMEEKSELMGHVAHQTICMQYILELSKQLDMDPRGCVASFFTRIQVAEATYKESFEEELRQFKLRIERRAKEKLEEALKEQQELEKQERLGPGGLDPEEVFEELPEELQKCFNERNIPLLQETIAKMPKDAAVYFMKRCVDSGLWVPERGEGGDAAEATDAAGADESPATSSPRD